MTIEKLLELTKNEIDGTDDMTLNEFKKFIEGILVGIYLCEDYNVYEKIEHEIQEYVEEKYDIFIF